MTNSSSVKDSKKAIKSLCDNPLLIEAHVGATAADLRLAFPERRPAEVLQARLDGQVVTVGKSKLKAVAVLEPPLAQVAASDDARYG